MLLTRLRGALALALLSLAVLSPLAAFAADAVAIVAPAGATTAVPQPDGSVVFLRPLIDALLPYIIAVIGAIITALGTWAVSVINSKTKIQISNDQKDRLLAAFKSAAQTQAGVIFAKLDASASSMSIDV